MKNSPRGWLIARHLLVAPLVALVTSFLAVLPGACGCWVLSSISRMLGGIFLFAFVGYCGVYCGARCLPQSTRRFGALGLTILGVLYYACFLAEWRSAITDEGKIIDTYNAALTEVILLAAGGLLATIGIGWNSLSWLWRRKNPRVTLRLPISNPH